MFKRVISIALVLLPLLLTKASIHAESRPMLVGDKFGTAYDVKYSIERSCGRGAWATIRATGRTVVIWRYRSGNVKIDSKYFPGYSFWKVYNSTPEIYSYVWVKSASPVTILAAGCR